MNFLFLRTWSRRRALSYFLHLPEPTINDERQDLFVSKAVISRVVTIDNIVFYSKNIKTYWRKKLYQENCLSVKIFWTGGGSQTMADFVLKFIKTSSFCGELCCHVFGLCHRPGTSQRILPHLKRGEEEENCLNSGERGNLNHNCRYFNI